MPASSSTTSTAIARCPTREPRSAPIDGLLEELGGAVMPVRVRG